MDTKGRTILLPFDGSENAIRAIHHAIRLARDIPALQFELLHVFQTAPPGLETRVGAEECAVMHAEVAARIHRPATELLDQAGVTYSAHCRGGAPANEIARHVHERDCEAIIMGTRGMGAMSAFFIGSVASRVLYFVAVPVTLIK